MVTATLLGVSLTTAPAEAVTKKRLMNSWVPSMCEHPAGRLVDGKLPEDDDPNNGSVEVSRTAVGPLAQGKGKWGAVAIRCNAGGVAWPDHLLFYRPNGKFVRGVDLFAVTKGGREFVTKLAISKRRVRVRVEGINQGDEAACCGTASASLTFRVKPGTKKVVMAKKKVHTERRTAKAFTRAMNQGKLGKARRLTNASIVKELAVYGNQKGHLGFRDCREAWNMVDRTCTITFGGKKARNPIGDLSFTRVSWKTWRGSRWEGH